MDLSYFKRVIEATLEITFGIFTLEQTQKDKDQPRCHLLLQLQDFVTVGKANRAMWAGDIGQLMSIWKRWSVIIQRITGLIH